MNSLKNILYIDRIGREGTKGAFDAHVITVEKLFTEGSNIPMVGFGYDKAVTPHIDAVVSEMFGLSEFYDYSKKHFDIQVPKIRMEVPSLETEHSFTYVEITPPDKIPLLIFTRETRPESFFAELSPDNLGWLGYFFDFAGALKKSSDFEKYSGGILRRMRSPTSLINQFNKGTLNDHFGLWGFDEADELRKYFSDHSEGTSLKSEFYMGGGPRWNGGDTNH